MASVPWCSAILRKGHWDDLKESTMIKLSLFHYTIYAYKFSSGIRAGLFVLIMSRFKNNREVA